MLGGGKIRKVLRTLNDLGVLETRGEGPWRGTGADGDEYPIDWVGLDRLGEDEFADVVNRDAVHEEALDNASGGSFLPPPDVLDAQAWYQPIHYYGPNWGIRIWESAIDSYAGSVLSLLPRPRQAELAAWAGCQRAAVRVLFLHEAFHHKIESLAIRLEVVERERRYGPYMEGVYQPLQTAGSDDLVEESLACAEMYRAFNSKRSDSIPDDVRKATRTMLLGLFPRLPAGYRRAGDYISNAPFRDGNWDLASQVQEALRVPRRVKTQWLPTEGVRQPLFNCDQVSALIVAPGATPRQIPTHGLDVGAPGWIRYVAVIESLVETRKFRKDLDKLPSKFVESWESKKAILAKDAHHPSLNFEKLRGTRDKFTVRLSQSHRVLLSIDRDGTWIAERAGTHDEVYGAV